MIDTREVRNQVLSHETTKTWRIPAPPVPPETIVALCDEVDGLKAELAAVKSRVHDAYLRQPDESQGEAEETGDSLLDRLRGIYTIPVNDGAGPLNGSMTFTRRFPTLPLNLEAAEEIAELKRQIHAVQLERMEVEQTLGKVLGYPTAFPEVSEVANGSVCVGEHTVVTLAMEAVGEIVRLRAKNESLEYRVSALTDTLQRCLLEDSRG